MTPLVAAGLSAAAIAASLRALARCVAATKAESLASDDPLEQRLAERERALVLALGSRNGRALGRAALFGGTGCAVWELTGGSAHYPVAAACFGLGFFGWAICGEIQRRIGSMAGVARALRKAKR